MKTNDQLLWRRAQVTILAVDGVATVPHGLITPSFTASPMSAALEARVLAIPVCFGFLTPANLTGWAQLVSVANNGDGTFTFTGPNNMQEDITINVLFLLPHTWHGPEDVPGTAAASPPIAGQLLIKVLEIGTGSPVVPLSSIFVGSDLKPSGGISGPSEIQRVQVIPIMGPTTAGDGTLLAWQGCTVDIDPATNSLLFNNVGEGPILALILMPHTTIGPVNADNWPGTGPVRPAVAGVIKAPGAPNGQLLMSRENLQLPAAVGSVDVVTLSQVNQAYDPQGAPEIQESIHFIPLAPLDDWLTGAVGHSNVFGVDDNRFVLTNNNESQSPSANMLFWLIHTILGPGGENPAVYAPLVD